MPFVHVGRETRQFAGCVDAGLTVEEWYVGFPEKSLAGAAAVISYNVPIQCA